ncbi:MAG TPA: TetR/AcrR family transcriptional regulator [Steroidobacteraceae bacterium]|nr:TetR/AcrR family transcriptional regulator [Steroidobacteraceae bacterium]
MPRKTVQIQDVARRLPKQDRALHKIDLIFEATVRLLDSVEIVNLTTNAIAAKAGISIGTLYQYFDDKDAILDALSGRELKGLGSKVMESMDPAIPRTSEERLRLMVSAVFETYGGRRRVHKVLLEHALSQRRARLNPLFAALSQELSREGRAGPQLTPAEAFVLTNAIAGVLRAVVTNTYPPAQRPALEEALNRLVTGFVGGTAVKASKR